MPLAGVPCRAPASGPRRIAFPRRLAPMAVRRVGVVDRGKVAVPMVVAGLDVVHGVGAGLAAEVADPPVAGEDARHDPPFPAGR